MADSFGRVFRGDRVPTDAATVNGMLEVGRAERDRQYPRAGMPKVTLGRQLVTVLVQNKTGAALPVFSVVCLHLSGTLTDPPVLPGDNLDEFKRVPSFQARAP